MTQENEQIKQEELAEQMTTRLRELRDLAIRINELHEQAPVGSQLHQGLKLVDLELRMAGDSLERLVAVTRILIV